MSPSLSEHVTVRGDSQALTVFSLAMMMENLELMYEPGTSSLPLMLGGVRLGKLGHSWSYQICNWESIRVTTVVLLMREGTEVKEGRQSLFDTLVGNAANLPGSRVSKFLTLEGEKKYTLFPKHLISKGLCSIKHSIVPEKGQ